MSKLVTAAERIVKAKKLLGKARAIPRPLTSTFVDFRYVAQVKEILRDANDLIKFITYTPLLGDETRAQVEDIKAEMTAIENDLLKSKRPNDGEGA